MKIYFVILWDKSGVIYIYIVRIDGIKFMFVFCDFKVIFGVIVLFFNFGFISFIQKMLYLRDDFDVKDEKKGGIFSLFFCFIKEKIGKSKSGKFKRKLKFLEQRKC